MTRRILTGLAVTIGAALCGCHRVSEKMEITESREISPFAPPPAPVVSSAVRFGLGDDEPAAHGENPLNWVTPEGWTDAPAGSDPARMRLIDLRFGEKGEGECALSILGGGSGGLEANINRWRGQMGLPALSKEDVEKLPKKTLLGREATFVTFDGNYTGVGASEARKDSRMTGLLGEGPAQGDNPGFMIFAKMVGPRELVIKNEAAFDQFVQSIGLKR